MWAGGGGEAASWQPKRLPGTYEGPKGEATSDCNPEPWVDRPGTEFHAKTEVTSGWKLDVENVERRETYLGRGGLHIRDKTTIFIQCGH